MPGFPKLSHRIARVYEFIVKFKSEHGGNSPTIREIAYATDISSTSVVNYYLESLEKMGMIKRGYPTRESRMITVIGAEWIAPQPQA